MSTVGAAPPKPAQAPLPRAYTEPPTLRAEIRRLKETSFPVSAGTALADHALGFGLIALVVLSYARLPFAAAAVVNVLALVGIARAQRGLECLVHEASHYNWSRRRRRLNDLAANLLAAIPVFSTVGRYRVGHFIHHRMKGAEEDPCLRRYSELDLEALDRSRLLGFAGGIIRRLPRYIVGWWIAIRTTPSTAVKALAWHGLVIVLPVALVAGPSLALFVWGEWMGAFVLVLPVIRLIGEADEHKYRGTDNVFDATMINDGRLLGLLIHPHNDGYHLVHHLWPSVPHHKLGRLHALLEETDPERYAARVRRRGRVLEDPPPLRTPSGRR